MITNKYKFIKNSNISYIKLELISLSNKIPLILGNNKSKVTENNPKILPVKPSTINKPITTIKFNIKLNLFLITFLHHLDKS